MAILTKDLIKAKEVFKKKGGVVILDWKVFEKMRKEVDRLKKELQIKKEIEGVREIIEEGEKEYKEGKIIKSPSLKDAFKIYLKLRGNLTPPLAG